MRPPQAGWKSFAEDEECASCCYLKILSLLKVYYEPANQSKLSATSLFPEEGVLNFWMVLRQSGGRDEEDRDGAGDIRQVISLSALGDGAGTETAAGKHAFIIFMRAFSWPQRGSNAPNCTSLKTSRNAIHLNLPEVVC